MRITASIPELARITGKHETTMSRHLNSLGLRFIWKKGSGGNEKHYVVAFLPEEYRIALAAIDATPTLGNPTDLDGQKGAEAARKIIALQAEEVERAQIAKEDGLAAFERLPEQRKNEASARYSFLQMCDNFVAVAGFEIRRYARRSKVGDKAFIQAFNEGRVAVSDNILAIIGEKISYSTLNRIAGNYYKYGLAGLAFGYHNPKRGSTTLSGDQQNFVLAAMCKNPVTSTKNIRKLLQGRFGMVVPSSNIIHRYRNRWTTENADLWLYYSNPDAWKSKKMFAFGSASENVKSLNQLWEADSTPADVMLVDGRHSIIGMIDVYSRRLRFVVSKTSRATSVISVIRHSLIEWGVPDIIKTDNGKDYVSNHVVRVIDGLGIDQQLCRPFQGQEKPHIERAFKTFLHGLVELMPNYIGHNVTERKAIEARRSFSDRVMNKDSKPVEIGMSSIELQKFCNEWTNFVYQYDEHGGLGGKRPIDMVRNWQEPVSRIHDMRALDMLLMPAPKDGGIRTIGKEGVRVDNKCYGSAEFAGLVGEKVFVLLDPADLGTIYVYLQNQYGERSFLCPAIDPVWVGIDTARFAVSSKKHQERLMKEGKRELKKLSKDQGVNEAYTEYVDLRKSQVDNIIELPVKTEEYTTPALGEGAKAVKAVDIVRSEDAALDALILEVDEETLPSALLQDDDKLIVLRSDSDQYELMRAQVKAQNRKLSQNEYDWLGKYYETASGRAYMTLQGDMRETIGLAETHQAEA